MIDSKYLPFYLWYQKNRCSSNNILVSFKLKLKIIKNILIMQIYIFLASLEFSHVKWIIAPCIMCVLIILTSSTLNHPLHHMPYIPCTIDHVPNQRPKCWSHITFQIVAILHRIFTIYCISTWLNNDLSWSLCLFRFNFGPSCQPDVKSLGLPSSEQYWPSLGSCLRF